MKDYSVINEDLMDGIRMNVEEVYDCGYDQGYDQGYEDGKKASCDCKDNMEAEYNRGLNEAWEVIQNITSDDTEGGYSYKMLKDLFGFISVNQIVQKYTPQNAIWMIKTYEEQQKQDTEIKVGDEVFCMDENDLRVVVRITQMSAVQVSKDGKCAVNNVKDLHKTGRTFPQIAEVLAEMRGDKE